VSARKKSSIEEVENWLLWKNISFRGFVRPKFPTGLMALYNVENTIFRVVVVVVVVGTRKLFSELLRQTLSSCIDGLLYTSKSTAWTNNFRTAKLAACTTALLLHYFKQHKSGTCHKMDLVCVVASRRKKEMLIGKNTSR
jgi:hypothetical protein